jgi:O-antigen/teichoic acid export membrane protein
MVDDPMPGVADPGPSVDRAYLKRRLVANTGASIAANVWAIVVSLVVVPIMISGLGVEAFGVWALIQTFSAITGWFSLADLGVGIASLRAIARHHSRGEQAQRDVVVSTTLVYYAVIGLVAALLFSSAAVLIVGWFDLDVDVEGSLSVVLVLVGAQIGVDLGSRSLIVVLEGLQRVDVGRALDVVRRTLVAGAWALAASSLGTLTAVSAAGLAASSVSSIIAVVIYARVSHSRYARPSRRAVIELLKAGAAVAVLRPIGVVHRTMDRVLVGILVGPTAVAAVELATNLQNGADAVLSATSYAVTPSASSLDAHADHAGVRALLLTATRITLLVTLPIATTIALLSTPILDVWVGEDVPPDSAALASLGALYIVEVAVGAVASNMLLGLGRSNAVLRAASISVAINLALSVWWGRVFGARGVFAATCVSAVALVPGLVRPALKRTSTTWRTFVVDAVMPGFAPSAALSAVLLFVRLSSTSSRVQLSLGLLALVLVSVTLTYALGLRGREREFFRRRLGLAS